MWNVGHTHPIAVSQDERLAMSRKLQSARPLLNTSLTPQKLLRFPRP